MKYATTVHASTLADPIHVFEARAWAHAYLSSHCDIPDLLDAVDPLQACAIEIGLVDCIGQDGVQKIISDAFAVVRSC
ncbi:MAG: hypothetical protein NTV56_00715 [Alphaproteobacteria bacterium]|nr:hypothetical protein [Alphaproteobacteria bacterium]